MTNKDKFLANERREQQFIWADGRCIVCGKALRAGHPQLAHRVIASKYNRKNIPDAVLHHPLNTIPVDNSGSCNSSCILHGPEAEDLISRIERVIAGEEEADMREEYEKLRNSFSHLQVSRSLGIGDFE